MVAKLSGYELQQRLLLEQQPVIPWHFQSLPVILQGGAGLPIKTLIWQIFGRFWNCALKYLHQRFRPKMRIWPCIHTTLILIRPRWFPYIHGSHCGLIPPQKKCENISTFIQVFLWIMKMFPDLEEKNTKMFMGFPEALSYPSFWWIYWWAQNTGKIEEKSNYTKKSLPKKIFFFLKWFEFFPSENEMFSNA